jgi:hypothetical protein
MSKAVIFQPNSGNSRLSVVLREPDVHAFGSLLLF